MADAFPRLLKVSEVADRLCCSRSHVYKLIGSGRIPYVDIGTKRVPEDGLRRFITEKRTS